MSEDDCIFIPVVSSSYINNYIKVIIILVIEVKVVITCSYFSLSKGDAPAYDLIFSITSVKLYVK